MKLKYSKLILVFIFAISSCATAQVTYSGLQKNYTQSMDSLLLNVNKQNIATGILYDRILSFGNLDKLKLNNEMTKSNYGHFIQSWSELNRAAYLPSFINVETLKSTNESSSTGTLVNLGIINTKINCIDFGTSSSPKLSFANGRFGNVANVNPFTEKQVTVIAALKETATGNNITFKLTTNFILQLSGLKIKNLTANFGTGTIYNLISNQVLAATNPAVNYTTSGPKELTFTVTFENNTSEVLKANINVILPVVNASTNSLVAAFPTEEDFVTQDGIAAQSPENITSFQGYNDTTPSKGVLEYRTYYNLQSNTGSSPSKIKKEIIIMDGFDPGDKRKIYTGSIDYDSEKASLYELMIYKDINGNPQNFVDVLRNAPYFYDVTLVNFPLGTDYIERNAMALVGLLKRENQKLASNGSSEKITIIGPSMGGLISRYALAYMEKNNIPHNTKLWVSLDSPHLGANIPIACQETLAFFGFIGGKEQARNKFLENFASPAARQMLVEQLISNNGINYFNGQGQNNNADFRQTFINSINTNGLAGSNGYPQNLRKISLVNGTSNGAKTNFEGMKFLELAAFKPSFFKAVTIENRFLASPNNLSQTFSGKISIPTYITIFGTQVLSSLTVIESTINRININPRGSMDIVQGGTFNTASVIKEEFEKVLAVEGLEQQWRIILNNHSFIPSVSSLAFKHPNFDWNSPINRNLVCDPGNKEIYFDSYFSPQTNESHIMLNASAVNWLLKEIQGAPQPPYFPVDPSVFIGDKVICLNQPKTYQFTDLCKIPGKATFSVTGNLVINSFTDYAVTVQSSNGGGAASIIADFGNGLKVEKNIWIGRPATITSKMIGPTTVLTGALVNYSVNSTLPQGAAAFEWWLPYPYDTIDQFDYFSQNWQKRISTSSDSSIQVFTGYARIPGLVQVMGKNECGCGGAKILNVAHGSGGGGIPRMANPASNHKFKIYPNPSKDIVTIDLRDENNAPDKGATISGELYDIMGTLRSKVAINNNKATFSVLGLNKGIYVLKIYINDQIEAHQIAVE